MRALRLPALEQFKVDLSIQLASFAPELHGLRGEAVFRNLVDDGVARAERYGFTNRGPLRFFVECMVSYGSAFDTDVQIPGLQESLTEVHGNGQAWHADRAFAVVERYQIQALGRGNEYAVAALRRVGPFLDRLDSLREDRLDVEILELMARVHPEKFDYVGRERLLRLLASARQEAERWGIGNAAGVGLLTGLMFALGHGVTRDPLYPWVGATLARPKADSPARHVERLRRKTRMYLQATLKRLAAH